MLGVLGVLDSHHDHRWDRRSQRRRTGLDAQASW